MCSRQERGRSEGFLTRGHHLAGAGGTRDGFASTVRLGYREGLSPSPRHLLDALSTGSPSFVPPLPPGLLPQWSLEGVGKGGLAIPQSCPPTRGLSEPLVGPPESLISPSGLCGPEHSPAPQPQLSFWASEGSGSYNVEGEMLKCEVLYRFKGFLPDFLRTGLLM